MLPSEIVNLLESPLFCVKAAISAYSTPSLSLNKSELPLLFAVSALLVTVEPTVGM